MRDRAGEDRTSQRILIGAGIAAAAAGAAFIWGRKTPSTDDQTLLSDAPPHVLRGVAKETLDSNETVVGRTVTIGRPRQEIYETWRNFTRFPEFMENVTRVDDLGSNRSRWLIKAPAGGEVELVTRIVEDVPGDRIAWESEDDSEVDTAGILTLKPPQAKAAHRGLGTASAFDTFPCVSRDKTGEARSDTSLRRGNRASNRNARTQTEFRTLT